MAQPTVALTDLILCIVTGKAAYDCFKVNCFFATIGFMFISLAAGAGVFRFSGKPDFLLNFIVKMHSFFTNHAAYIAPSLLGIQYLYSMMTWDKAGSLLLSVTIVIFVLTLLGFFSPEAENLFHSIVSFGSGAVIFACCIYGKDLFGFSAALLFTLASVFGSKGEFLHVLRVNWFHIILAVASFYFRVSFLAIKAPPFNPFMRN